MTQPTYQTSIDALELFLQETIPQALTVLRPPPKLKISDWADRYRILSSETSAEGGSHWHTDRAEYLRGIMDAMSNAYVEIVSVMKPVQSGGTQAGLNMLGYYMHQDPSPILNIEEDIDKAKWYADTYLVPMIRDTGPLTDLLGVSRGKNARNRKLEKTYRGGYISIVGAKSPAGFSSRPARIIIANDVDRYPASVGNSGDPLNLAIGRTTTFWNKKIYINSTPLVRGLSRIEDFFFQGSQNHFVIPCPLCGSFQKLVFGPKSQFAGMPFSRGMIVYEWDGSKAKDIFYKCGNCQKLFPEKEKFSFVRKGKWISLFPDRQSHQSFHYNQLISFWVPWADIIKAFEQSKHSTEQLRVVINERFAETFDDARNIATTNELMDLREDYEKIPAGVIILTAFIDVQDDRLECYVEGWGMNQENWLIDYYFAEGNPEQVETWRLMETYLFGEKVLWQHENGYKARTGELGGLMAIGIDTAGHHTTRAYQFCRKWKSKRVFGTIGRAGFGRLVVSESKSKKVPVRLLIIGVDEAKQIIYDRLADRLKKDEEKKPVGYLHFNKRVEKDYFDQLLSERKAIKVIKGRKTIVWEMIDKNRRNEALDCKVGNLAIYQKLNPRIEDLADILKNRMDVALNKKQPAENESDQAKHATHKKKKRLSIKVRI